MLDAGVARGTKAARAALLALGLLAGLVALATPNVLAAPASAVRPLASACPTLQFVGVRGSGEKRTDADGYGPTVDTVRQAVLRGVVGSVAHAVDYPAVAVLEGGVFKYGDKYRTSVNAGKNALSSFLNAFHTRCADIPIVLVGYSQGAHVAGDVYRTVKPSLRNKVIAMALFGDPRFNPAQPQVNVGTYDRSRRGAWPALLQGPARSFLQAEFPAVHSYCLRNDPVCNWSPTRAAECARGLYCTHTRYIDFGYPADAARWILGRVPQRPAPNRYAVTSYDRMAPGAPHHGYFIAAWQPFVARSNRITYLGVTVGNPRLPAGQSANVTIRLCPTPDCSTVLAQASPQVVNYGNSAADIGDVPVTPGATYYVVWYQPAAVAGSTWVTYWWAGGPRITLSDQLQAVVKGYNA